MVVCFGSGVVAAEPLRAMDYLSYGWLGGVHAAACVSRSLFARKGGCCVAWNKLVGRCVGGCAAAAIWVWFNLDFRHRLDLHRLFAGANVGDTGWGAMGVGKPRASA